MQDGNNKERKQKSQRDVWIGPEVKALYVKGGVEVEKQSAQGKENVVKTVIAFPNVEDPCSDKCCAAFFPEDFTD